MTPPRSPPLFEITPASRSYRSGGTVSLKRTCRCLLLAEIPGKTSVFQVLTAQLKTTPPSLPKNVSAKKFTVK